jgi:hypothetical protein
VPRTNQDRSTHNANTHTELPVSRGRADGLPRRRIELARAGWGAALLLAPRQVLEQVHHVHVDRKSLIVARILGARHLSQAALSGIGPSPDVLALGIWADCAHAATALTFAALDPSRARAALTDAAIAAVWAGAGCRDLATGAVAPPRHERRRDDLARRVLGYAPGGSALLHLADTATRRGRGPRRLRP